MRKHLKLPALLATATLSLTLGFGAAAAPASASAPASAQSIAPAALTLTPQLAKKPSPPRNPKKFNVLVNKTYPLAPKTYAPKTTTIPGTDGIRLQTTNRNRLQETCRGGQEGRGENQAHLRLPLVRLAKEDVDQYTRWYGPTKALSLAAKPGTSEHQTGLSLDVGNFNKACALQDCFRYTPVGKWMAKNAPKYGFVLRYPKGQEKVTGYKLRAVAFPLRRHHAGPRHGQEEVQDAGALLRRGQPRRRPTTKPVTYVKPSTKTTTQNVNLRQSATTASTALTLVKKGTKVRLTGKASGVWVQVKVGTRTGWMSSQYLR